MHTLKLNGNMRFIAVNNLGLETVFDSHPSTKGEDTAATPMEIMLQSLAACTSMDIVSILRKKRVQIDGFTTTIEGERAPDHPKTYVSAHLQFILVSPNGKQKDLDRAAELSQEKYCGAAAMFRAAGCDVAYETILKSS